MQFRIGQKVKIVQAYYAEDDSDYDDTDYEYRYSENYTDDIPIGTKGTIIRINDNPEEIRVQLNNAHSQQEYFHPTELKIINNNTKTQQLKKQLLKGENK